MGKCKLTLPPPKGGKEKKMENYIVSMNATVIEPEGE